MSQVNLSPTEIAELIQDATVYFYHRIGSSLESAGLETLDSVCAHYIIDNLPTNSPYYHSFVIQKLGVRGTVSVDEVRRPWWGAPEAA